MASKRNSFLLRPSSYTREFNSLSLPELGLMFKAIYAHAGAEHAAMPELSPLLRMALSPIFNEMDRAAAEYEAVCQKRAEGGKLGGRPKTKRPEIEPQGVENNLKVAQGCSRGHEGRQGGLSKHKNPYNDNEYDNDTTTAKENKITTTKLCSIDREAGNLKVPLAPSRGHEQPRATLRHDDNPFGYEDQPPPDYDPADEPPYSCSFDVEQDMALQEQDERSEEDRPF
jgi:hypothetical protein